MLTYVVYLVVFTLCFAEPMIDTEEDYYWRKFTGSVPSDAVPGGYDEDDNMTYIGRIYKEGGYLVPGEIRPKQKLMFYEWGGVSNASVGLRILCAKYTDNFEWIKVNNDDFKFLWSRHIVQGGYYARMNKSEPFLIGRTLFKDQILAVGRVLSDEAIIGLRVIVQNTALVIRNDFELLSYNPKRHVLKNCIRINPEGGSTNSGKLPNNTDKTNISKYFFFTIE